MMETPKHIPNDPKAAELLNHKELLGTLLQSPDTKKLIDLLNQSSGGNLKTAANSAAKGDTKELMNLLNQVMSSEEGNQTVSRIKKNIPEK